MKNASTATETAIPMAKAIPVVPVFVGGAIYCLESYCESYSAYVRFPAAVLYNGVTYVRTGWNSDRNYVCYKSSPYFQLALGV